MTIAYSSPLSPAAYLERLQKFIKAVEGEKFAPYVDVTGNPTIGWGFALDKDHLATPRALAYIIETVLGVNNPYQTLSSTAQAAEQNCEQSLISVLNQAWAPDHTKHQTGPSTVALQKALNDILSRRAIDIKAHTNGYDSNDEAALGTLITAFAFATVGQIVATFGIIKKEIDRRLAISLGGVVPETNERIALFAMQYLGAMNHRVRTILNAALGQSDSADARAQAWFAIRYQNIVGWEPAQRGQRHLTF